MLCTSVGADSSRTTVENRCVSDVKGAGHGFRNYPHRKQHPTSRFHLFRRDPHLARLVMNVNGIGEASSMFEATDRGETNDQLGVVKPTIGHATAQATVQWPTRFWS